MCLRWEYKKTLEFIHAVRPQATIKPHFLEELKLLQSIFLSEFRWHLSTTWSNISYSPIEDLIKNTFLNSRKGDVPKLEIEESQSPKIKKMVKKPTITWDSKQITSISKNPLSNGLVNFKEAAKSTRVK